MATSVCSYCGPRDSSRLNPLVERVSVARLEKPQRSSTREGRGMFGARRLMRPSRDWAVPELGSRS